MIAKKKRGKRYDTNTYRNPDYDWTTDENKDKSRYEMLEKNLNLVHRVIRDHFWFDREDDDVFQIGCMALWDAINLYDPELGSRFSAFAYFRIQTRIHNYVCRKKMAYKNKNIPTDFEENDTTIDENQQRMLSDSEYFNTFPAGYLRECAEDMADGMTIEGMAKKRNISFAVARRRRDKFIEYMKERYSEYCDRKE